MKIRLLIFFMCIFCITKAQNEIVVVGGGSMSEPHLTTNILKYGEIKYKIPKLEDEAKIIIFSYNFKEKTDFSNGKTRYVENLDKTNSYILALGIEENDIWAVLSEKTGMGFSPFKRENKNIKIKLYPFVTQSIVTNQYIPLGIALNAKNTIPEEILNRVLATTDTKNLNKDDINYIKNNSTYFEIITMCIKTWKK